MVSSASLILLWVCARVEVDDPRALGPDVPREVVSPETTNGARKKVEGEKDEDQKDTGEKDKGEKDKGKKDKGKKNKDEKDKGKKNKVKVKVEGRVMAGWLYENSRVLAGPQEGTSQSEQRAFLHQARIRFRFTYNEHLTGRVSIELQDAFDRPNPAKVPFLRTAYGNIRVVDAFQIRFGRYRRPFSRLEMRGAAFLPFRGRGLGNGLIVEDWDYGGRSTGIMFWGDITAAKLRWHASLTAPAPRTIGVDALGRLECEPWPWLSLGVNGGYKVTRDLANQRVEGAAAGGDLRVKFKGLYVLADAIFAQNYLDPEKKRPWATGLVAFASYDFALPRRFVLQPTFLAEWADGNLSYAQSEALRLIGGLNVLWTKHLRVLPQVELVRPLGRVSPQSPWLTQSETYYIMLSVQM